MASDTSHGVSRRRLLGLGVSLLAVGPLAAACQSQPAAQPPAAAPPSGSQTVEKVVTQVVEKQVIVTATPQPKTYEIKMSMDWNDGPRKQVMDAAKKQYEQEHPNVKITHWHLGTGGTSGPGGMTDIVVAQLATNTAADVIGEMAWAFHSDYFDPIDAELKTIGWNPADYFLVQGYNESDGCYLDGKQYGVPFNTVLTCYYYNVDLFQKAGVKLPTDDWTFDDELSAAQALTKASDGIYGFHARDYMDWGWGDHLWAEGAEIFSDNGTKVGFDEGGAPDRFQWYTDLIYKYKVSPGPAEATHMLSPGISEPFVTGKIGIMSGQGSHAYSLPKQIGDRFKMAVMPTAKSPTTGKRAHLLDQSGLVSPKTTKQRGTIEEAVKYAAFFNSDYMQKLFAELRPTMPSSKKWIQSPEYTKAPPENMIQLYKNLSGGADTILMNAGKGIVKVSGTYNEAEFTARRHISTAFTPEGYAKGAKKILVDACAQGSAVLAKCTDCR